MGKCRVFGIPRQTMHMPWFYPLTVPAVGGGGGGGLLAGNCRRKVKVTTVPGAGGGSGYK